MRAFWRVLRPTLAQTLGAIFLSLCVLVGVQSQSIFSRLSASNTVLASTRTVFADRFNTVLQSSILGQVALVAFWAAIGLVVYLVCWGAYNAYVSLRNEVVLETAYINRTPLDGPWLALVIKIISAGLFVAYIMAFQYGISLWLALTDPVTLTVTMTNVIQAGLAVLGLAAQLYGLLIFVQLTVTPWYTFKPFTQN